MRGEEKGGNAKKKKKKRESGPRVHTFINRHVRGEEGKRSEKEKGKKKNHRLACAVTLTEGATFEKGER